MNKLGKTAFDIAMENGKFEGNCFVCVISGQWFLVVITTEQFHSVENRPKWSRLEIRLDALLSGNHYSHNSFKTDFFILEYFHQPIKRQCSPHIETSQLICTADQLTGFYMRATLALNGIIFQLVYNYESRFRDSLGVHQTANLQG